MAKALSKFFSRLLNHLLWIIAGLWLLCGLNKWPDKGSSLEAGFFNLAIQLFWAAVICLVIFVVAVGVGVYYLFIN